MVALGAFFSAMLLTKFMIRFRIMDMPSDRSSHAIPTPRAGGVAVIISVLMFLVGVCIAYPQFIITYKEFLVVIGCAFGIGVMGLIDDIRSLSFRSRLLLQAISAGICVLSGISLHTLQLPLIGTVELGVMEPLVTILWMVGFTNVFNFWDGLNGLASGCAMIAIAFLIGLSHTTIAMPLLIVYVVLLCAIGGFFVFNFPLVDFPRAQIFLGDTGSQFIGFVLAGLGVLLHNQAYGPLSVYTVPLLFFSTICDVLLTWVQRWRQGKPLTQPHRDFLFHRLHRTGWSHAHVSLLQFCFMLFHGIGAIVLQKVPAPFQWIVFVPCVIVQAVYAWWVLKAQVPAKVK